MEKRKKMEIKERVCREKADDMGKSRFKKNRMGEG